KIDFLRILSVAAGKELKAAGSKLVVVDFTASWCGPCKMIAPVFEVRNENKDVVFLKVDVDEASDVSEKCGISSMPTFQFYKNGEKLEQFSGASEEKLRATVAKLK
uniref:Thioredoxin domain-containing protein n=1 Tax=Neogobius melanostomus TaxID=47308 RepID=A0A8C6U9P3_9GOBI